MVLEAYKYRVHAIDTPQHSTHLVFTPIVYVILYAPRIRSVPAHSGGAQALGRKLYDHWSIWKGQDMNVLVIE
jgi:hypothetical protein